MNLLYQQQVDDGADVLVAFLGDFPPTQRHFKLQSWLRLTVDSIRERNFMFPRNFLNWFNLQTDIPC